MLWLLWNSINLSRNAVICTSFSWVTGDLSKVLWHTTIITNINVTAKKMCKAEKQCAHSGVSETTGIILDLILKLGLLLITWDGEKSPWRQNGRPSSSPKEMKTKSISPTSIPSWHFVPRVQLENTCKLNYSYHKLNYSYHKLNYSYHKLNFSYSKLL